MKKHIKYSVIISLLLIMGLFGCNKATVTAPISPDDYPTATFTTEFDFTSGEIIEGDVITYKISLDRPFDKPMLFSVKYSLEPGTADEHDVELTSVTIDPYKTEGELSITIVDGDYLDDLVSESLKLEVGVFNIGERYNLSPATVNPIIDLNIVNSNICFAFEWDVPANDIDTWIEDDAEGNMYAAAFTGDDPEVMSNLDVTDPDGLYYFVMDPYDVTEDTDYILTVTHPDLTTETFTGTVLSDAVTDALYTITKTGNTYVVAVFAPKSLPINNLNPKRNN